MFALTYVAAVDPAHRGGRSGARHQLQSLYPRPDTGMHPRGSHAASPLTAAQHNIQLNRKVLSELAVHEPSSFRALAMLVKQKQAEAGKGLAGLL